MRHRRFSSAYRFTNYLSLVHLIPNSRSLTFDDDVASIIITARCDERQLAMIPSKPLIIRLVIQDHCLATLWAIEGHMFLQLNVVQKIRLNLTSSRQATTNTQRFSNAYTVRLTIGSSVAWYIAGTLSTFLNFFLILFVRDRVYSFTVIRQSLHHGMCIRNLKKMHL